MESLVKQILGARVYDVAEKTPLDKAERLSVELGNTVLVKREDQQSVFSFKLRGAYNKIVRLTPEQRAKGVIAASAGNHAQGVALAGKKLGCPTLIVMPNNTPAIKVSAVEARGGETLIHGDNFDEANTHALHLSAERGMVFIPPYDDLEVIAGQGTVGVELLQQCPEALDVVFVPVGGGGLIAGIASYIKYLRPEVRIVGVEPEGAACLKAALDAGERVVLDQVDLFADGVAVKQIGEHTFDIARQCVDEVVTVNTDEICAAVRDLFIDLRAVSEPAGAVGLAGLRKYAAEHGLQGKTLATISTGANVNFDRLRHIAERAESGANREAMLAVTIPEEPGAFLRFCKLLGERQITEFNYRYAEAGEAHIFVGVRISGRGERRTLVAALESGGYQVLDMSSNEMAKIHVRYMVGGHASVENERLFRFEFPERPGALLQFLNSLQGDWNISLFHYRNHGAAWGRVLAGIQAPEAAKGEVDLMLNTLGYRVVEETKNPAYEMFLA